MSDALTLPLGVGAAAAERPSFADGEILGTDGRYQVLGFLNTGIESEIYAAADLSRPDLGPVALRAYIEWSDAADRRIDNELGIHGALSGHAGIIVLHGSGITEVGGRRQRFSVLELAARGSLADSIERGPHGTETALGVAASIVPGMEAMHAQGIVHRDIKPSNVFGVGGEAWKIGDFGIATRLGGTAAQAVRGSYGTLGYIPPEGLDDEPVITPRFDTFAFGVTIFRAATGEMPFRFDPKKPMEYRTVITHESPVSMRDLERSVPAKLDDLTRECFSPRPGDRPSDEDLLRTLATI